MRKLKTPDIVVMIVFVLIFILATISSTRHNRSRQTKVNLGIDSSMTISDYKETIDNIEKLARENSMLIYKRAVMEYCIEHQYYIDIEDIDRRYKAICKELGWEL